MTRFLVYDVFTDTPFGGNPLAVIPDASGLTGAMMQRIAREFNFSESAFVLPPENATHTAKVRIFTPTMEVPFAGHPIIGTAVALADLGKGPDMALELGVGPIPCRAEAGTARLVTKQPLRILSRPEPALVADCIGLQAESIRTERHAPVQATVGLEFVLVELTGLEALQEATPVVDNFRIGAKRYPTGLDFAIFCYVRDGQKVNARMFAPLDNMPEDPATGSAAAALTALLSEQDGLGQSFEIRQGVEMGRPSLIHTRAELSSGRTASIEVSGKAVRVMQGELVI